jgi:threonine dehydratase
VKLDAIEGHGADARLAGETYDEVEVHARALADEHGWAFVPSFDDEAVAAGQATIALELLDALPELADGGEVAIPLSGGGLAGGMAYALAERAPRVRVSAVSARRARVMWESLEAGGPVELPEEETLASALSGGIGLENRVTMALVRDHVHRHVLVEEDAIARAVVAGYRRGLVLEGGGAVALAALLEGDLSHGPEGPLVLVLSGGNLDPEVLGRLIAGG